MVQDIVTATHGERDAVALVVAQDQLPVAQEIDVDDLNVRLQIGDVIATRQAVTYPLVALLVVDAADGEVVLVGVVVDIEEPHFSY